MSDDAAGFRALLSGARVGQFVSVGAVGAGVDTATTLVLQEGLAVFPEIAKLIGAECAIVMMFLINEHWTFAEEGATGRGAFLRRLLTSNVVRSGGLAVQLVVYAYVRRLPVSISLAGVDLWTVLPILIAIGSAVIVNYVAESLFTWRVHR